MLILWFKEWVEVFWWPGGGGVQANPTGRRPSLIWPGFALASPRSSWTKLLDIGMSQVVCYTCYHHDLVLNMCQNMDGFWLPWNSEWNRYIHPWWYPATIRPKFHDFMILGEVSHQLLSRFKKQKTKKTPANFIVMVRWIRFLWPSGFTLIPPSHRNVCASTPKGETAMKCVKDYSFSAED